ncbi:MAG: hypothetical protein J6W85_01070 [Lachnospiraceae bacterium]|nr:hypothetical protein [Lachnospiraceae bacterium]
MKIIKERLQEAVRLYFVLVTLISVLLMILGMAFDRDRILGYEVFLSPLIYAAIGIIPVFFFGNEKEISMKRLLIQRFITLGFIETVMLALAFSASTIPTEKKGVVIGIAVGIVVVYVLSLAAEYLFELGVSKSINKALAEYQSENGSN